MKDTDIEIGFDDVVGAWYLEAFSVRQYLAIDYRPLGQRVRNECPLREIDFLGAGKRARKILEQKLKTKAIQNENKNSKLSDNKKP